MLGKRQFTSSSILQYAPATKRLIVGLKSSNAGPSRQNQTTTQLLVMYLHLYMKT